MKVNPNNFFKRELDTLPPHFVNTVIKAHESDIEQMRKWIYENCHGRYSITRDVIYEGGSNSVSAAVAIDSYRGANKTFLTIAAGVWIVIE